MSDFHSESLQFEDKSNDSSTDESEPFIKKRTKVVIHTCTYY